MQAVFLGLMLVACNPRAHGPHPGSGVVVKEDFFKHTVANSGESWAVIAEWYTGSKDNAKKVQDANPTIKSKKLKVGQVIKIPTALVKKELPLPKEALAAYINKGGSSNISGKPASEENKGNEIPEPEAQGEVEQENSLDMLEPPEPEVEVAVASDVVKEASNAKASNPIEHKPIKPKTKTREELLQELLDE